MNGRAGLTWWVKRAVVAGCMTAVAACSPITRNHGWVPSPDELEQIRTGVDTRDTVANALGAPTSGGVLDESGFYYVRSRVEQSGLAKNRVVERQVVAISFNSNGTVSNVSRLTLEEGAVVVLETRVTDSTIQNNTLVRQLLGGLGRVSFPGGTSSP